MSLRSRKLPIDPIDLANRLLQRDRDAVPQALNLTDDVRSGARDSALAMLDVLERELPFPGAARIGVTGAPGAGKSTLLDAFVRSLRSRNQTVGITAIDPSSKISGGALLGDPVRTLLKVARKTHKVIHINIADPWQSNTVIARSRN